MQKLTLNEDEVHVWYTFPGEITRKDLLDRYYPLLNVEESVQQKRFHFERHRHQYLVTRAMIRTLLARYLDVPAHELRFTKNAYGRPELAVEHMRVPIHFNLSHTDGLIVCAMVLSREVGVDVEDITRGGDLVQIADRFFSPSEVNDLHAVPVERQEDRFFDYWTLKEAYIKARGMGLSIPLEQFSYHIDDRSTNIAISIDPRQQDEPSRWQFRQWRCAPHYKIALCLERRADTCYSVHSRKLVPLDSDGDVHLVPFRSSDGWSN